MLIYRHRVKKVCIPVFGLNTERYSVSPYSIWMRESAEQNNSEYGHSTQWKSSLKMPK